MLKIRDEHLSAFSRQQSALFVGRMAAHLREIFAAEVAGLNEEGLRSLVEKVCARIEPWGITQESQVERFLELFVSFHQLRGQPLPDWVNAIVVEPERCGEQILRMLEDRLLFEERT